MLKHHLLVRSGLNISNNYYFGANMDTKFQLFVYLCNVFNK